MAKETAELEFHEAANIFPLDEAGLDELAADIKDPKNGQLEDIQTYEGKILDGRRRYLACRKAGVNPRLRPVDGECRDPVARVLSLNLHRRHLTPSQRAAAAVKAKALREKYERENREKQREGNRRGGEASGASRRGEPKSQESFPATSADKSERKSKQTRDKLGEAFGVSGRLIDQAEQVMKNGTPELIAQVEEGSVTVHAAAEAIKAQPVANGPPVSERVRNAKTIRGRMEESGERPPEGVRLADHLGGQVGMAGRTLQMATAVVEAAEEDGSLWDIVKRMDADGKVNAAYAEMRGRQKSSGASSRRRRLIEDDIPAAGNGQDRKGVKHAYDAIDCLRNIPHSDPYRKRCFQIVTDWIRRNS